MGQIHILKPEEFMKFLSFLLLAFSLSNLNAQPEKDKLDSLTNHYFLVNPAGYTIPGFLKELTKNGTFVTDTLIPASKNSLLYWRGYSTKLNPFSFPVSRLEMQIRQTLLRHQDQSIPTDTVLVFQLIARAGAGEEYKQWVKKETALLYQQFAPCIHRFKHSQSKRNGKMPFEQWQGYQEAVTFPVISFGWAGHYTDKSIHTVQFTRYFQTKPE
jgi:hypothetical protein